MSFSLFGKKKSKKSKNSEPAVSEDSAHEPAEQEADEPANSEPEMEIQPDSPDDSESETDAESLPDKKEESRRRAEDSGGFFRRLKMGLSKTRALLTTDVDDLLLGRKIDENLLEELEEKLITSDLGVETSMSIVDRIREVRGRIQTGEDLKALIREEILREMDEENQGQTQESFMGFSPKVILVTGVNGVGKTTTIGKMAALYTRQGKKVILAAGDTFRAAACEQLAMWAERSGATLIRHKENSDPASVAYDALDAAIARKADIVLVDTAGRLHNKVNLMEELKKIRRTLDKRMPGAPHETLLVLDATTGQNALKQAEIFHEAVGLTGLVLTKLDGTARGGIVVSIQKQMGLPIRYIGVGEAMEDLQPFDAKAFLEAMF
ncbi:signal recognition particle-docking protein FtsY [Desulfobotulus alkaliphilus]|uniref:Signal recognition particle receptor FtsY n=1 Tax=Desulfobotulus alkaliphilus TaxID=622671 RepID=A0A562R6Y0_9BACT|nr:signal recognition particle-docking protein FtsY [Desulfobotulus alkaliphilus]TWI64838.1 signal recognition particle-docking protein FtsY [Desulfobotulus alkaliphilus]